MKITPKLILLFLFTAFLPIGIMSFFLYYTISGQIEREVIQKLEVIADLKKNRLAHLLETTGGKNPHTLKKDIEEIAYDYSGLGETGETLIARRDTGGFAVSVISSRFNANAAQTPVALSLTSEPITQAVLGNEMTFKRSNDYRQREVVATTRYVSSGGWGLVVKMDRDEALAPAILFRTYLLYIAAVSLLVVSIISLYEARALTSPIMLLTRSVQRIAGGSFDEKVPIRTHDELGILASFVNSMATKLKSSYGILDRTVDKKTAELARQVIETREQIAKDEALLASIGDGVIATNEKAQIIIANASAQEMLLSGESEIVGQDAYVVLRAYNDKNEELTSSQHPIRRVIETKKKVSISVSDAIQFARKDQSRIAVSITATPVTFNERMIGVVIVFRDATREREIDRMKTEFISLASHQLRTPLAAIRWYTSMLLVGDVGALSPQQKEFVEKVNASNDRMVNLVTALLNISRMESGRMIVDPEKTDLVALVEEVLSLLKPAISSKHLRVSLGMNPDIPQVNIDKRLIREVYANLLSNAVQYTPPGGRILVTIYKRGNEIVSQIADSGYGIAKKERHRIFEKFFRGTNILPYQTDGSGLGLYLAKAIVNSSGGHIWFFSEEGRGATFFFSIPLVGTHPQKGEVTLS